MPSDHSSPEVPGNNLSDYAQRLMKVIGDRVVINLGNTAFLRPQTACKVAKVIDRQRNISGAGFPDRFPVVPGFRLRQFFQFSSIRSAIRFKVRANLVVGAAIDLRCD